MKTYAYKAKKGPNEIVKGQVIALNKDEAVDKVNDLGLVPVDLWEVETKKKDVAEEKKKEKPISQVSHSKREEKNGKVKSRDLLIFYRQMSKLMRSGVPLLKCLYLMSQENASNHFKVILEAIHKEIREGNNLSAAMHLFPAVFTKFDIAMIQTGEATGKLDEILLEIANYREKQKELTSKVRSALAYPAFIIVMAFFTVLYMLTSVIPNFAMFFKDLGQDLPLLTRLLIATSQWLQKYILLIGGGGVILFFTFKKYLANPEKKLRFDGMILKWPLLGNVLLKAEIARMTRTLELLLKSGIPIIRAVRFTSPVIKNEVLKQEIEGCAVLLEQGNTLSSGLRASKYFPRFVTYFIGVGEESGKLEESLSEISDWYEKDTEEAVKIMTSLLEPAIILIVGAILALIIMAVLLPVFSMNAMVGY